MNHDVDRQRTFSRRAAVLAGGKLAVLGLLGARLYDLQSVQAARYVTLAEENRINVRLIPPPRGRIFDRYGKPLAVNHQDYRVLIVAEQTPDVEATLEALRAFVPLRQADQERVLKEIRWKRKFVPVAVVDRLTWEDVATIEVNTLNLPGLLIEKGLRRHYPQGRVMSHVLGYVGAVAPKDAKDDPLLELPSFRIGKSGIEKTYDLELRGKGGRSQLEVNAVGRVIRELERQEGIAGTDITLAIDLDLQVLAYNKLAGESGAVVVMDVHSGEIRALVSKPGFDPNAFTRGLSVGEWRSLISNRRSPLTNKAISGQYAPGSTYKMATALAALEQGTIDPDTTVTCTGRMTLGNATFHCWNRHGHGTLSLHQAIAQSCDVYFYEAAKRTGVDAITAMARRLGLGHATGIDLPGERTGLLPTKAWKRAAMGASWQQGETVIAGIGQGYVLATPLQLAVMSARIANGFTAVTPRLIRARTQDDGTVEPVPASFRGLDLDPDYLKVVRDGMIEVVNGRLGTARASAIAQRGYEMAGKTGTSQVRRISAAERASRVRKNEELPWEQRDHALFVGYAPITAPRFAVAVVVEHGGGGSKAAAPIARDILMAAQRLPPQEVPVS
ncbi:MAG: penicillin-binding protein 2 [Hyphomicrobiales bacterium]|nr:penicillin-binding protein 2 [Hyphomicrobiales bacterium]